MRPRIRSIKPEMRQDEKYCALSRDSRELFNGLITYADDEGRFRARRSEIIGHVFPDDPDAGGLLDGWIAEIKEQGMILFYVSDGTPYGAFRHWAKHQKINRPTPSDLPPPPSPRVIRENGLIRTEKGSRQRRSVSDNSASSHDDLTEDAVSPHSPPRGRAFRSDPGQICSLTERLASKIRANDPKADPDPLSERWLRDMRLLVEDRGGDVAEVERIIDWCQADAFWHSNILSPVKLRKQFTQLVLKANGQVVAIGAGKFAEYDKAAGL